jgi:DNA-binding MarR family transcriptional regulator
MDKNTRKPYWVNETTVKQNDCLVLSKSMIRSKAFIGLTGAAKQILLELRMRLTLENYRPNRSSRKNEKFYAKNNGKLKLTYKSIHKQFGYSTATISKAIDRLVDNGFIEIAELGCGVQRKSHKIALIKNWEKFGTEDFKPGIGKSNKPINGGFKKRQDLKITSEAKAGKSLKQPKPP